jgi:hypothetical protein
MADLAAKIAKARKAGYSDAEIAAHISKDAALAPKFAQARKAGYSDEEILGHLGKVSPVADIARGAVAGLRQGMASMVDMAAANTPFGQLGRMSPSNPLGMPTLTNPIGTLATRYAARDNYAPQTTAGKYAKATGAMIPNALAPGGLVRRAASVVLPGVAGEGARQAAEGMGGNALAQGAAQLAGNVVGGGVAAARVARQPATAAKPMPRQNANELAARAAEYRAAGINPALVDVVDDAGRGAVRAAASRMTPARQKATDFQDARALDLPSRMGRQARRVMSQDARTPDQIRAEMAQRRSTRADAAFGAVRRDEVQLAPEGVEALRTDYGRAALREAARRERDPDTRAALNRLADAALDAPSTPITVGMADRVSRVLLGQAQEAARRGDNDLATTLGGLGRSIRSPTAQASPGYRQALDDFGADTRLQEAAEVGEDLLSPNTDEFAARAANLSDEERALALAAGRRAIERKAGENVGAAPRVARAIATAPEQQARNAALMGPERAGRLQTAMGLEERLVRNANDIAPRFGTQSQNKAYDAAQMAGGAVRGMVRGDWLGVGMDWLKSRGMNDAQAEALVNMALDPAQTDQAIALIGQRFGQGGAQQFIQWRNAALIGATGASSAAQTAAGP